MQNNKDEKIPIVTPSGDVVYVYATESESRAGRVIAFALLFIFLVLILWAVLATNNRLDSIVLGQLEGATDIRMGSTDTITLSPSDSVAFDNNTVIEWYVDGQKVSQSRYLGKDSLTFNYQPTALGHHNIKAKVGKESTETIQVNVARPLLTIKVDDVSVEYGQPLQEVGYSYSGLLEGDNWQQLQYAGNVAIGNYQQVGVYQLNMDNTPARLGNYDVEYTGGYLTVLPRKISITGNFCKQYDGNNQLSADIELEGVLEGDDVYAVADTLYFDSKDVGQDKCISTNNIVLQGDSASNYCLVAGNVVGTITAKEISLKDVVVNSKLYDGTKKAEISDNGNLYGVVDGDIVVIGSMEAAFRDCKIGKNKKVDITNITLVGKDKDNYCVKDTTAKANIVKKYIDLLVGKEDVVQGNQ